MTGGSIAYCDARYGGAIYSASNDTKGGQIEITGGTIEYCSSRRAAALYLGSHSKFDMYGGTIQNCSAAAVTAGVYHNSVNSINIGGGAVINGNTLNDGNNTQANLYLTKGKTITLGTNDKAPTKDMNISVSLASDYIGNFVSNGNIEDLKDVLELDNPNAQHVVNGIVFEPWSTNNSLPTNDGYYYLTVDVTLSSTWTLGGGVDIQLDLNGHTVAGNNSFCIVNIDGATNNKATLALYDSDPQGRGTIKNGSVSSQWSGGGVRINWGTFNMYGGTITNCKTTSTTGGAGGVYIGTRGTFNMYGGKITNCSSSLNGGGVYIAANGNAAGVFNMTGGVVDSCSASNKGGGVYIASDSNTALLNMTSGTVSNCTAQNQGGGVYVGGAFEISGGSISGNTSSNSDGGGIFVDKNKTLNISGDAVISGNKAKYQGGGIYNDTATLTITGGEIKENQTIDENSKYQGAGIYNGGSLTIGGTAIVKDNQKGETPNNLYLPVGKTVTLGDGASAPSEEMNVSISLASGYSGSPFSGTYENISNIIKSDNSSETFNDDGSIKHIINEVEYVPWTSNNSLPTKAGRYYLTTDVTITAQWSVSNSINLDLNGHTINLNSKNIGLSNTGNSYSLCVYDSVGTGKITGGFASYGGAVYVNQKATFALYGGTIENCSASNSGGAIIVKQDAYLKIYGGTIKNCTATTSGGAVYVSGSAHFTMFGGTIDGCSSANGGGITVASTRSDVSIKGGVIKNCSASSAGGGLFIAGGSITMSGGEISNNTSAIVGGGVGVGYPSEPNKTDGTFVMTGGSIKENICNNYGGGICIASGTSTSVFQMSGGEISDNIARNGGGVHCGGSATSEFTMTGGSISGNEAKAVSGGTVAVEGGGVANQKSFAMTGGSITGNSSTTDNSGGGVLNKGNISLGGTANIKDNTAGSSNTLNNLYLVKDKKITLMTDENAATSEFDVSISLASDYNTSASPFDGTCENISNKFSSDDPSKSLGEDGKIVNAWSLLQNAFNGTVVKNDTYEALNDGTIKLKKDVIDNGGVNQLVVQSKDITLDLNGFTINANRANATDTGRVFAVAGGKTFTILDSSESKTGRITGGKCLGGGGGLLIDGNSTVNFNGGTIDYCETSGTSAGGGIYVASGKLNINGGTISNNKAGGVAGGLYVTNGSVVMNEGTISNNTSGSWGGGVSVETGGTFTLNDGLISNNTAKNWSGGIAIYMGTVYMNGGEISNNITQSNGGGGLCCFSDGGVFVMSNGTIKNNTAATDGGGVWCYNSGSISISNTSIVENNTAGRTGQNVYSSPTNKTTTFSGGEGTEQYPYLITDNDDLSQLAYNVNKGNPYNEKYFKVTDDLLYEGKGTTVDYIDYETIGIYYEGSGDGNKDPIPFKGNFDGGNHTITIAFKYNQPRKGCGGLFGYVVGGTIKNVIIAGNVKTHTWYGGALAGKIVNTTVDNCINKARINSSGDLRGHYIAGLCGIIQNSKIINCINEGNVYSNIGGGGIVGQIQGTGNSSIENCYNTGTVTAADSKAGGIAGDVRKNDDSSALIKNCYSSAVITAGSSVSSDFGSLAAGAVVEDVYFNEDLNPKSGSSEGHPAEDFTNGTIAKLLNENATPENGYNYWSKTPGGGFASPESEQYYVVTLATNNSDYGSLTTYPTRYIEGETVTLTATAQTGYSFMEYEVTSDETVEISSDTFTMPGNDVTIKAVFAKPISNITYNDKGGSDFSGTHGNSYPTTHSYGTATTLVSPTKTGYTFGGWYLEQDCSGDEVTTLGAKDICDDVTIYAKWIANNYKVVFNSNDGNNSTSEQSFTYDEDAKALTENSFTRTGYTFSKWNSQANGGGTDYADKQEVSNLTSDNNGTINLYAVWSANSYTITYKDEGGNEFSGLLGNDTPESHTYGSDTTLVAPTKTGYTFKGWYINQDCSGNALTTLSATGYTANITLFAKWQVNEYAITYKDYNNATFSGTFSGSYPSVHKYDSETILVEPTRTGYTFVGWYKEASCDTKVTSIGATDYTDDITLYASWIANMYSIVLHENTNGAGAGITVSDLHSYDSKMNIRENDFTKKGYTFVGWNTNADGSGDSYSDKQEVLNLTSENNGTFNLYAIWSGNTYYITYKDKGGSDFSGTFVSAQPTTHTNGTVTELPILPTKTGYTFVNWHLDENCSESSYATLGDDVYEDDVTVYADWAANTTTISFVVGDNGTGGSTSAEATYDSDMPTITLPTGNIGYTFIGFFDQETSGNKYYDASGNSVKTWDKDVETSTLYAQYTFAKVDTTITTIPSASAITYGQTLANSTLSDGVGSVEGTFTWTNSSIAPSVSDSNSTEYDVTFTPTNSDLYNSSSCKVKVTVNKATPSITTVPSASAITYGQTLANSTLSDGEASVDGTFAWKTSSTAPVVSDSDSTEYDVVFTPSDTANYNSVELKVKLTVNKQSVTIPSSNDSTFTYSGTSQTYMTLSGSELYELANDSAELSKTNAGTSTIKLTLKDSDNYKWANDVADPTYTFTINKASLTVTANDKTISYTDEPSNDGVSFTGFVNDETSSVLSGSIQYSYNGYTASSIPGSYDITPSGLSSDNYSFTYVDGTLTVTNKKIDKPTAVDKTYTYTGEAQTFELNNFDSNTMNISNNSQTNANTTGYTVSVTPKTYYEWSSVGNCTFTWVIGKATPTITTIPNASAIAYGQTLANSTLSGGEASTAGDFTWTNNSIAPAVSDSESTEYQVTFTPTDSGNYNSVTCDVTLTVNKASVDAPSVGVGYTIDYINETITVESGYEISTTSGANFDENILVGETGIDFSSSYYVRIVADDNHLASSEIENTFARSEAPSAPTADSKSETTITVIAVTGQEYSINNGESWTTGTGTITFEGLTANTQYEIITRILATSTSFISNNSNPLTITTDEVKETEYNIVVTDDGNGSGQASETTAIEGTEITLSYIPKPYYEFDYYEIVSGEITISDNKFTVGTSDIEIKVHFVEKENMLVESNNESTSINDISIENLSKEQMLNVVHEYVELASYISNGTNEVNIYAKVSDSSNIDLFKENGVNETNAVFADIDLFAKATGGDEKQVTDTNNEKITITITLTQEQAANIIGENRTYYVLRQHDSELTRIETTMQIQGSLYLFSFESDKFSTFALCSEANDKPIYVGPNGYKIPRTGVDSNNDNSLLKLSSLSLLVMGAYIITRKKRNRKQ